MTLNKRAAFFCKNLLLLVVVSLIFGCASQQKPQGGPKDRTPPKLLKATPPNMTRNFKEKQIRLDFDEYFKLNNPFQEITLSPAQEKPPNYKTSKKSIIIDFKDTLQKETTYVINFGKAIADVNEGNVVPNFTYVFSTGSHIDSLSVSGSVLNTLTQEKEKEVTVMLFPIKQDTLFGKKKPTIYATTDSSGNFSLNNLHDGDYRIYALKESAPNKIYDNDNELVAFQKEPVHLTKDTSGIHLTLFKQDPDKFRLVDRKFDQDGKMFFTFNRSVINPSVKIIYPAALNNQKLVDFNKTRDTALVYMRNMDFDSIRVAFLENNKPLDTISLRKGRKESFERTITLQTNTSFDNKLKPNTDLIATANVPIESFDATLITLNEDSTNVANYTLVKDTPNMKKLTFKYKWKPNSRYQLIFNEGALINIYGDKNKKIPKIFEIDKVDNYGVLNLKINLPDTGKAYVVELIDEQKKVIHTDPVTKGMVLNYNNYPVGKYTVRIVYDSNKNGKWDSGNVKQKRQPENVWLYGKQLTIRANWEAEEPIDIPKEPTTP
jgi:uncharacterized protein (DUF2141 family)